MDQIQKKVALKNIEILKQKNEEIMTLIKDEIKIMESQQVKIINKQSIHSCDQILQQQREFLQQIEQRDTLKVPQSLIQKIQQNQSLEWFVNKTLQEFQDSQINKKINTIKNNAHEILNTLK